jgi:tetratricopeptide (TPR) repeat protein
VAINREKVLDAAHKYIEKQKYDKAVIELQRLVDADPRDARTLQRIAELQARQRLYAEAIDSYEMTARLYANEGFTLKAVAVYKQIREMLGAHASHLAPRYGHVGPKLADLYCELGLTNDALVLLDEIASSLQHQQKDAEAIALFRRTTELDSANPLRHLRLAEALSRVRDLDGAAAEFEISATLLRSEGRRDDALQVLERLLQHRADPAQARICAELYLARNRPPHDAMQALGKLQICIQANPRDVDAMGLIASAFDMIGQPAKAAEVRTQIARLSNG